MLYEEIKPFVLEEGDDELPEEEGETETAEEGEGEGESDDTDLSEE
jgi:hypothetical protein